MPDVFYFLWITLSTNLAYAYFEPINDCVQFSYCFPAGYDSVLYLQVTVENPAEYAAVWIAWDRFKYPAAGFILTSVTITSLFVTSKP